MEGKENEHLLLPAPSQHLEAERLIILDTELAMKTFRETISAMTIIDIDMVEIGSNILNAVSYKQVPDLMAQHSLMDYFRSHGAVPGNSTPDGEILANAVNGLYIAVREQIRKIGNIYDNAGVLNYVFSRWLGDSMVIELFKF